MCKCTPSIRTPFCLKCMPVEGFKPMDYSMNELVEHPFDKIKEIIKDMEGLSEDGFRNKYINDPRFHKGLNELALLISRKGESK